MSSLFVTLPVASPSADDLEAIIRDCPNVTSCKVELSDDGMMFEEPYAVRIGTGERVILIRQETFARMLRRARELLGSGGDSIVFEEGLAAGRFEANQLAAIAGMDRLGRHELQILNGLKARGWGRTRVVKSGGPSEERTYLVDGSLECTGQTSDRPFSQFVRGYIGGFHEGLWGVKITCTELKCVAEGGQSCEFKLSPSAEGQKVERIPARQSRKEAGPRPSQPLSHYTHLPVVYYSQKHVAFQVRARFRNVPGALADVLKRLADAGLNLESTSGYVEADAGVGVFNTFGQATHGNPGREGL